MLFPSLNKSRKNYKCFTNYSNDWPTDELVHEVLVPKTLIWKRAYFIIFFPAKLTWTFTAWNVLSRIFLNSEKFDKNALDIVQLPPKMLANLITPQCDWAHSSSVYWIPKTCQETGQNIAQRKNPPKAVREIVSNLWENIYFLSPLYQIVFRISDFSNNYHACHWTKTF